MTDPLGFKPRGYHGPQEGSSQYGHAVSAYNLCYEFLKQEALSFELPSLLTAFVATRIEAGQRVGGTMIVPNAIPSGWDSINCAFASSGISPMAARDSDSSDSRLTLRVSASKAKAASVSSAVDGNLADTRRLRFRVISTSSADGSETVVFDSVRDSAMHALPASGRLTAISATAAGIDLASVNPQSEMRLLVGDPSTPRAKVRLTDLLAVTSRPLNLRWTAGETVRLVLTMPTGFEALGYPPMDITLEWER